MPLPPMSSSSKRPRSSPDPSTRSSKAPRSAHRASWPLLHKVLQLPHGLALKSGREILPLKLDPDAAAILSHSGGSHSHSGGLRLRSLSVADSVPSHSGRLREWRCFLAEEGGFAWILVRRRELLLVASEEEALRIPGRNFEGALQSVLRGEDGENAIWGMALVQRVKGNAERDPPVCKISVFGARAICRSKDAAGRSNIRKVEIERDYPCIVNEDCGEFVIEEIVWKSDASQPGIMELANNARAKQALLMSPDLSGVHVIDLKPSLSSFPKEEYIPSTSVAEFIVKVYRLFKVLPVGTNLSSLAHVISCSNSYPSILSHRSIRLAHKIFDWVSYVRDLWCPFDSYLKISRSSRSLVVLSDCLASWTLSLTSFVHSSGLRSNFSSIIGCSYDTQSSLDMEAIISVSLKSCNTHGTAIPKVMEFPKMEHFLSEDFAENFHSSIIFCDLSLSLRNGSTSLKQDESNSNPTILNINQFFDLSFKLLSRGLCPMIVLVWDLEHSKWFDPLCKSKVPHVILRKEIKERNIVACALVGSSTISIPSQGRAFDLSVSGESQFHNLFFSRDAFARPMLSRLDRVYALGWKEEMSISRKDYVEEMYRITQENCIHPKSDSAVYGALAKYHRKYKPSSSNTEVFPDVGRANARVSEIVHMLGKSPPPTKLLDIGCSDGSITVALGNHFMLAIENIHGCDTRDVCNSSGFTYSRVKDSLLPYEDSSFDLIICMMVLHHFEDLDMMLREIFRVLAPGGKLIIREHDCPSDSMLSMVLDVMHGMYALVLSDPPEMPIKNFGRFYWSYYRSKNNWRKVLIDSGLEVETRSNDRPSKHPFAFYYDVFFKGHS